MPYLVGCWTFQFLAGWLTYQKSVSQNSRNQTSQMKIWASLSSPGASLGGFWATAFWPCAHTTIPLSAFLPHKDSCHSGLEPCEWLCLIIIISLEDPSSNTVILRNGFHRWIYGFTQFSPWYLPSNCWWLWPRITTKIAPPRLKCFCCSEFPYPVWNIFSQVLENFFQVSL